MITLLGHGCVPSQVSPVRQYEKGRGTQCQERSAHMQDQLTPTWEKTDSWEKQEKSLSEGGR